MLLHVELAEWCGYGWASIRRPTGMVYAGVTRSIQGAVSLTCTNYGISAIPFKGVFTATSHSVVFCWGCPSSFHAARTAPSDTFPAPHARCQDTHCTLIAVAGPHAGCRDERSLNTPAIACLSQKPEQTTHPCPCNARDLCCVSSIAQARPFIPDTGCEGACTEVIPASADCFSSFLHMVKSRLSGPMWTSPGGGEGRG